MQANSSCCSCGSSASTPCSVVWLASRTLSATALTSPPLRTANDVDDGALLPLLVYVYYPWHACPLGCCARRAGCAYGLAYGLATGTTSMISTSWPGYS